MSKRFGTTRRLVHRTLWAMFLAGAAPAMAQPLDPACGNPFSNNFGPHDYRTATPAVRKIVEDYHFTPRVESLLGGASSSLGADIDYTLRALPNHHRALASMMNLGTRSKRGKPEGAQFTVECYFKRALAFRPDDLVAWMIYASYLGGTGRKPDALRALEHAVKQAPDNGFTQYNAGLLYLELNEPQKALEQAHRAARLGFARPDLKARLQSSGRWQEPTAEPASPASAASPASSPASDAGASAPQ